MEEMEGRETNFLNNRKSKKEQRKTRVKEALDYTIKRILKTISIILIIVICIFLFCGFSSAALMLEDDPMSQILSTVLTMFGL